MITGDSGTYAKLIPSDETREKIALIMTLFNLENHTSPRDLHVTLIHSHVGFPITNIENIDLPIIANGKAFNIFENGDGGNCLVVELESDDMHKLHNKLREDHGATHNYDSYNPHLTLSYDYTSSNVPSETMLEHFYHLKFDKLVVEPLTFEWIPNE